MKPSRSSSQKISIPKTADGCSPTITQAYGIGGGIGISNLLDVNHFPKGGVLIITKYEAQDSD